MTNEYLCVLLQCCRIAATPDCSFPYTYNGGLFYACINNMTGVSTLSQPFACLAVNATPVVCGSPGALHSWHSVFKFSDLCTVLFCELEAQ